jgi:hypothetical protein
MNIHEREHIYIYIYIYIYIEREKDAMISREVQNVFVLRIVSSISEFKTLI